MVTTVLETKGSAVESPAEIRLNTTVDKVELSIRPPKRWRGSGGIRNVTLSPFQAKILGYALLADAERAEVEARGT
jgi:hypothetical protein